LLTRNFAQTGESASGEAGRNQKLEASEDNRKTEELLVDEWRKIDPYLLDAEGFTKFISDITVKIQKLEDLKQETSILDWANNNIQRKKYACISAVFTYPCKDDPTRYSGLFSSPLTDYLQFLELKEKTEKKGSIFLCIDVMHEETLDHDPERPHVKGTFSLHTFYDADWNQIEKPKMMRKIEKHLSRVSRWYSSLTRMEAEPYPTPPVWEN